MQVREKARIEKYFPGDEDEEAREETRVGGQ